MGRSSLSNFPYIEETDQRGHALVKKKIDFESENKQLCFELLHAIIIP